MQAAHGPVKHLLRSQHVVFTIIATRDVLLRAFLIQHGQQSYIAIINLSDQHQFPTVPLAFLQASDGDRSGCIWWKIHLSSQSRKKGQYFVKLWPTLSIMVDYGTIYLNVSFMRALMSVHTFYCGFVFLPHMYTEKGPSTHGVLHTGIMGW